MTYHVASTEQAQPYFQPASFAGRFERAAPTTPAWMPARERPAQVVAARTDGAKPDRPGPKGTHHAVEEGATATVCGLDVASLYDYPEIPWPPSRGDRCLYCRQWTPREDD